LPTDVVVVVLAEDLAELLLSLIVALCKPARIGGDVGSTALPPAPDKPAAAADFDDNATNLEAGPGARDA